MMAYYMYGQGESSPYSYISYSADAVVVNRISISVRVKGKKSAHEIASMVERDLSNRLREAGITRGEIRLGVEYIDYIEQADMTTAAVVGTITFVMSMADTRDLAILYPAIMVLYQP